MKEKKVNIQIFISTDDIEVQNTGTYIDDIHKLTSTCNKLLLNGLDTIYIHIEEPIGISTLEDALMKFCIQIEKYSGVGTLQITELSMPKTGGQFSITYTEKNNIKSGRYQISTLFY